MIITTEKKRFFAELNEHRVAFVHLIDRQKKRMEKCRYEKAKRFYAYRAFGGNCHNRSSYGDITAGTAAC